MECRRNARRRRGNSVSRPSTQRPIAVMSKNIDIRDAAPSHINGVDHLALADKRFKEDTDADHQIKPPPPKSPTRVSGGTIVSLLVPIAASAPVTEM